eukprot:1524492-Rhodomonas_salina.1
MLGTGIARAMSLRVRYAVSGTDIRVCPQPSHPFKPSALPPSLGLAPVSCSPQRFREGRGIMLRGSNEGICSTNAEAWGYA